jgi:WD40 repeat protein
VKLHGVIEASSPLPDDNRDNNHSNSQSHSYNNNNSNTNRNYNNKGSRMAAVSSVAVWETQGLVKIFTGSKDGFWRLWNFSGGNFVKEFENNMGGKVECLVVEANFLFCGFESISPALPEINVGMVHAWNLANPTDPPLEFHMNPLLPYAHAQAVTNLQVVDGHKVVSGSKDGSIKLWTFDAAVNQGKGGFVLAQTLHGHAREVTGLAVADSVLWSSSVDGSIRIWDMAKNGECQYAITMGGAGATPPPPGQPPASSPGHTNAVTGLVSFKSASGTFILSSSLDGDIKAWNGTTGQCVASEGHGEGVMCISMAADSNGKPLLLVGLESGNIMARNLEPTPKIQQAFAPILTLSQHYTAAHVGAVRTITQGPSGTFYSGGMDGKVLVFQFTGDLGL